jgi:hypothetical protein
MQNIGYRQVQKFYPDMVKMQLAQLPNITNAYLQASQQAFPTVLGQAQQAFGQQLSQQQQAFAQQLPQQQQANWAAFNDQMNQWRQATPQIASLNMQMMNQFAPQYAGLLRQQGQLTAEQYDKQARQFDPEFFKTYGGLSGRINEGLAAGYDLGSDLEREVQQSGGPQKQRRGNYPGRKATAAEAYGLGHSPDL